MLEAMIFERAQKARISLVSKIELTDFLFKNDWSVHLESASVR